MTSSILRQWLVLTLLPRAPRRIDTAALESRLRERGLDVHRRTVQRDLQALAVLFPLVSDHREKPYGWRWADDAELSCTIPVLPLPGRRRALVARRRRYRARARVRARRGSASPTARRYSVYDDDP